MSRMITGNPALASDRIVCVRDEYGRDPQGLPTRALEFHGLRPQVEAKAAEFNMPCRIAPVRGDLWSVSISIAGAAAIDGGDPDAILWSDKYQIQTATLQQSIFQIPLSWTAATTYDSSNPARFKKQLEDFAENSGADTLTSPDVLGDLTALPAPFADFTVQDVANLILNELARGATNFEVDCLTLSRQRSISSRIALPMPLYSTGKIYDAGQLNLPPDIYFSLPGTAANPLPPDPPQAHWGWRLRDQQSSFTAPGKIEQSFQWALAAWSTFLYEQSTTPFE